MVDCPRDDIRDLLPDLVHDQLEPAERVRVEQHLVDCELCAAELELLRSLRATAAFRGSRAYRTICSCGSTSTLKNRRSWVRRFAKDASRIPTSSVTE